MDFLSHLGKGLAYPVQRNVNELNTTEGEAKIRQSIEIILSTAPGERVMRPDFGCGIHEYVFAPNNARTLGLIRSAVEQALVRWEPRIELQNVNVETDAQRPTLIFINIDYRIRATDSRLNMVFPFYLQREESA